MAFSILSSIAGPKVTTGNASQLSSLGIFDPDRQVCPQMANVDVNSGIMNVSRDSIMTLSAGCNDPLQRIHVENALRPQYSEYLNASAISYAGVGLGDDVDSQSPMEHRSS